MNRTDCKIPAQKVIDKIFLPNGVCNESGYLFGQNDVLKFIVVARKNENNLSAVQVYKNGIPIQHVDPENDTSNQESKQSNVNFYIPQTDDKGNDQQLKVFGIYESNPNVHGTNSQSLNSE